eukprot:scaffold7168_cov182-Amphora_coffeaeformis.AAC.3
MNNNNARKRPRPDNTSDAFIPAETFQGSRSGYVFRQGDQGTGYYLDEKQSKQQEVSPPRRKGVRIAEENNETRVITTADALLADAEAHTTMTRVLDLAHPATLKASLTAWHKAVQENELQRAQYVDDPTQYMDSEVQLYEHCNAWKAIAADPAAFYPILLTSTTNLDLAADILGPLLQHANTDVSRTAISLLLEWLDPALLVNTIADYDEEEEAIVTPVKELAALVMEQGLLDLVLANLGRLAAEESLDETTDDDVGKGVMDILQLMEHFIDMESTLQASDGSTLVADGKTTVALYLAKQTTFLGWLFSTLDNESYEERVLEILVLLAPLEDAYKGCPNWTEIPPYTSVLMEDSDTPASIEPLDAIEILLQRVGKFRKTQPDVTQIDSLENAALVMHSILTYNSETHVAAFVEAQGIELVVRCLKERVHAAGVALKWLDLPGTDSPVYRKACEHMVSAGLLKYILTLWMGRALPAEANTAKPSKAWKHSLEQTVIRLVYALTRHLTPDSPDDALARLVAKFAGDAAKLERLVHYLILYDQKARTAEYKFYRSDVEDLVGDDEAVALAALEAKLAGGGDLFHRLGAIAAFLCVQSKQCHTIILQQLQAKDAGMGLVRAAVQEFASILEPEQRRQLEGYVEAL